MATSPCDLAALVSLALLAAALTACAPHGRALTVQEECARSHGVWRSGTCEHPAGGGGGGSGM